jgi:hypothetical protein
MILIQNSLVITCSSLKCGVINMTIQNVLCKYLRMCLYKFNWGMKLEPVIVQNIYLQRVIL